MQRLSIAACIVLCAGILRAAEDRPLQPDSKLLVTLAGGADRTWHISIPESSTATIEIVEQQGLAGVLSAITADGSELVQIDLRERQPAVKNMLLPPGAAQIRIEAENHGPLERIFEIRIGKARAVTEQDTTRFHAEQSLGEGERLFREQRDGYLQGSLTAQTKALGLAKRLSDPAFEATIDLHLAAIYVAKRDTKAALEASQNALDLWTRLHDSWGIAHALNEAAGVYSLQEQAGKEREAVARALDLSRSSNDSRNLAEALLIDADLSDKSGQPDQARAEYLEALQLTRTNGDRLSEADALSYLATFEHDHGRMDASAGYGTQALAISKEEKDQLRTASSLVRLNNVYASLGDFRKAIVYGEEALPLLKNPAAPFKYGNALYNLAGPYTHIDDFATALKDYNEALEIFRTTGSVLGQAYTMSGLAYVYLRLGDDAKADAYYRETAALFHKTSEKQGEVVALLALDGITSRRGELAKAIDLAQQAAKIAQDAGYSRLQKISLGDLAECDFSAHNYQASVDAAAEKLELIRKTGSAEKEEEANALRQQGRAWRAMREYGRAQEALNKALELYQADGTQVHTAETLYELAALDRDQGSLETANSTIAKSLDILDAIGADAGSAETRMLFAASHRKTYDLAIEIAMRLQDTARAFELSERARDRGFVDLIRGARLDIREGVDATLVERERSIEESLNQSHENLTRLLGSSHSEASAAQARKEVDDLVQKYEDVEAEIRRSSPRYAALISPRTLSVGDVTSNLLNSRTALLEFWLGQDRSYVWLVNQTGCHGFELPAREKIEALAHRAYSALTARNVVRKESLEQRTERINASDQEFAHASGELSRMLLGPLKGLSGVRRLWIVSDGTLEYLPFAALHVPGSSAPLVSEYEIARLPSVSVLAEVRQQIAGRENAARQVAIFADPVFQADDERVANKSARATLLSSETDFTRAAEDVDIESLPRLRFSRREADAIAALVPRSATRESLDFDANRAAAEQPALANYRVVHFATHALLDSRHPELSGLVLSMVDRDGHPRDGFLRLHEIYNLKLRADLVVLSGCETALGREVRSEGLVGLTRGFMYAGAPQVLASLWSVRDQATAEMMSRFYVPLLRRNLSPEAALRAAQLAMMHDARWSQPYYWAAFTMQGAR